MLAVVAEMMAVLLAPVKVEKVAEVVKATPARILQKRPKRSTKNLAIVLGNARQSSRTNRIAIQKELDELNKSKSANVNYQEDLKNLNDVYADKRIKAKQEEFTKLELLKQVFEICKRIRYQYC